MNKLFVAEFRPSPINIVDEEPAIPGEKDKVTVLVRNNKFIVKHLDLGHWQVINDTRGFSVLGEELGVLVGPGDVDHVVEIAVLVHDVLENVVFDDLARPVMHIILQCLEALDYQLVLSDFFRVFDELNYIFQTSIYVGGLVRKTIPKFAELFQTMARMGKSLDFCPFFKFVFDC